MTVSILIVEDEPALATLLIYNLEAAGYKTRLCIHGDEVFTFIKEELPDLILLDWMLPGMSGIEICQNLRNQSSTRNTPIIMTTALGEQAEKLRGFDVGADDYLVKPFAIKELLARIKAVLKRTAPAQINEQITSGNIKLNTSTQRVTCNNSPVSLGPTEFKLLHYLIGQPNRVFTRTQLLDNVWGQDVYLDERTVDVHIGRLRKALSKTTAKDPIRTIRGTGYSFDDKL